MIKIDYLIHRDDGTCLYHHGILGQKWGERNGPPYPLDSSDHSAAEKKAAGGSSGGSDEYSKKKKTSASTTANGDAVALLATYALATAAMYGLAYASAKKADNRRTKQYKEDYYGNREIKSLEEAPKQDPSSMSMDDHMKAINPDYPKPGTTMNCMMCTTSMAMRMKGYDVEANTCPEGWSGNNLQDLFENGKFENVKSAGAYASSAKQANNIKNLLLSQGDGAYGNLTISGAYGGGHSVFYYVKDNTVTIYDTQANEKYDVMKLKDLPLNWNGTAYCRLDDKNPTEYVLGAVKKKRSSEQ